MARSGSSTSFQAQVAHFCFSPNSRHNRRVVGKRLGLVEQFVRRRLRRNAVGSAAVAWAYERILRSQGDIRISRIANALDWSRKHLVARFNKEVGVGPKAIARMVRFNRALAIAQAARCPDWAELAVECGYADQAHLVREFHEFAGKSPMAFLKGAAPLPPR
jgi:transcriptional regulator GlxA family with amidase domain